METEDSPFADAESESGNSSIKEREKQLREMNRRLEDKREKVIRQAEKLVLQQESLLRKKIDLPDPHEHVSFGIQSSGGAGSGSASNSIVPEIQNLPVDMPDPDSGSSARRKMASDSGESGNSSERKGKKRSFRAPVTRRNSARNSSRRAHPSSKRPSETATDEDMAQLQLEAEVLGPAGMKTASTVRFYTARIQQLEKEIQSLAETYGEKEKETNQMERKLKRSEEEKRSVKAKLASLEKSLSSKSKTEKDSGLRSKRLENEMCVLKGDIEQMKMHRKKEIAANRKKDIRLNNALEEVDRCKELLKNEHLKSRDTSVARDSDTRRLMAENKVLQRQKNELLSAFKKQMRLIDVLKRQKMHVEASRLLSFTEDEFAKTLEIGEDLREGE
eukprot:144458_1